MNGQTISTKKPSSMANFKVKMGKWTNEKAIPIMNKVAGQRHLAAIRDGFAIIIPLLITSSFGIIILTSIFGGYGTTGSSLLGAIAKWSGEIVNNNGAYSFVPGSSFEKVSAIFTRIFAAVFNVGIGFLSVYFTFALGFFLAKSRNSDTPEIAGLLALGAFMLATSGGSSQVGYNYFLPDPDKVGAFKSVTSSFGSYFDSAGIFTAIFVTIFVVELFCYLSKNPKLKITMPDGVPPAVGRAFSKLIPVFVTVFSLAAIFAIIAIPTYIAGSSVIVVGKKDAYLANSGVDIDNLTLLTTKDFYSIQRKVTIIKANSGTYWNIADLLYMTIQSMFIYVASGNGGNLGLAIFAMLLASVLWFFGLHGTNIQTAIFGPIFTILLVENLALFSSPGGGTAALKESGSIFNSATFDVYVVIGGAGSTLLLLFATLWFSKRKNEVEVAKFAIPAGIFQINEPVTYGYPLVLNPVYAIPYIFAMPILVVTTWVWHQVFNPTYVYAVVPWTMPPGLGALFATGFDWKGPVIVLLNSLVSFAIWTPFVLLGNKIGAKQDAMRIEAEQQATNTVAQGV
jgi:PTS system cellobiose-specific IIC component